MDKLTLIKQICKKKISVKGHQIPLPLLVFGVLYLLYLIYPQNSETTLSPTKNAPQQEEIYNADGIRVYNLRKCNQSVCAMIENYGKRHFNNVTLKVTFHTPTGEIIYEGGVDVPDFQSHTRIKVEIPSSKDFAYAKFKEVAINQPLHH